MKKFFTVVFVALGVVFFVLLLMLAYLFIFDPWNLKPLFMGSETKTSVTAPVEGSTSDPTSSTGTQLSPAQAEALEAAGIAPAAVPTFTAAQLQCFEGVLGKTRVDEIKAGDTPSATEFFKAKTCI